MKAHRLVYACAATLVAVAVSFQSAQAGTIIKLSLGNDTAADLEYISGTLSTISDGNGGTTGDQNTAVEFLDFLSFVGNIAAADASYSLNGVTAFGPASVMFGTIVTQQLTGGNFQLYDDSNVLLLDATLGDSVLTGTIGLPAAGGVFSTTFGSVVGGTLAPYFSQPDTISVSITLSTIKSGSLNGLSVGPGAVLRNFTADATEAIAAIPEPTAAALFILGLVALPVAARRRS